MRRGEDRVGSIERPAKDALGLMQSMIPGVGWRESERREKIGNGDPAVGSGLSQRILRLNGPFDGLYKNAPQPADERSDSVVLGEGRRGRRLE